MSEILDLDALTADCDPVAFTVRLGGRDIDTPSASAIPVTRMESFQRASEYGDTGEALEAIYPKEDAAYLLEHLTLPQLKALAERIGKAFEAQVGTPGEG